MVVKFLLDENLVRAVAVAIAEHGAMVNEVLWVTDAEAMVFEAMPVAAGPRST